MNDFTRRRPAVKSGPPSRSRPPTGSAGAPRSLGEPVARYPYRDEQGRLLFEVVRFPGKQFRRRRPDPQRPGEYVWNNRGVRPVLYRLPAVRAADPAEPIFVVEGEKDVDRLTRLGLVATCSPGGAGKWREEYGAALAGRDVIILPDNDDPGRAHTEQVAAAVAPHARSVRVVSLPGVPEKGDVSDYLNAGGSVEGIFDLVAGAPEYRPVAGARPGAPPRRTTTRWYGHYRPPEPERPMPGPDESRRVSQISLTAHFDRDEVLDAVRPYLAELAEELGLEFAENAEVSYDGWRSCHAIDGQDRNPSASFNLVSGYYYDHRPPVEKLSLFDLAVRLQPDQYPSWLAALRKFGRRFVRNPRHH
jgi:hypothetical protein